MSNALCQGKEDRLKRLHTTVYDSIYTKFWNWQNYKQRRHLSVPGAEGGVRGNSEVMKLFYVLLRL